MEIESETSSNPPLPGRPGFNLVRTQKKLMLKRVFEIIKKEGKIKLNEIIAKMYIDEGFSKKTAKEYIEMLFSAGYISIEGDEDIVKIKRELDATS